MIEGHQHQQTHTKKSFLEVQNWTLAWWCAPVTTGTMGGWG